MHCIFVQIWDPYPISKIQDHWLVDKFISIIYIQASPSLLDFLVSRWPWACPFWYTFRLCHGYLVLLKPSFGFPIGNQNDASFHIGRYSSFDISNLLVVGCASNNSLRYTIMDRASFISCCFYISENIEARYKYQYQCLLYTSHMHLWFPAYHCH